MGFLKNLLWKFGGRHIREQLLRDNMMSWRIASATNAESGETVIIRIRIEKPQLAIKKDLSSVIVIEWPFESDDSMPSEEDYSRMQEFESSIDDLTGDNGFAEMVMARTGFGKRDWLFYTDNQDRFMQQLNNLLSGHERYPIQITFGDDPTWCHWQEILDSLHEAIDKGGKQAIKNDE
ncbi:MAG: DUF695 domain-containing protein [Armatimonadota bacterium]